MPNYLQPASELCYTWAPREVQSSDYCFHVFWIVVTRSVFRHVFNSGLDRADVDRVSRCTNRNILKRIACLFRTETEMKCWAAYLKEQAISSRVLRRPIPFLEPASTS